MTKLAQQTKAKRLRAQGRSLNEIVHHVGAAKSSVSLWVRAIKLASQQRQHLERKERSGGVKGRRIIIANREKHRALYSKPNPKKPRWPKRSVESFFDKWTPAMAYVLGYFAADGCMYINRRGSKYVSFTSTDQAQLCLVKEIMLVKNSIERYNSHHSNRKPKFALQIGSHRLFSSLIRLGFTPHKSLTLKFPTVPSKLLPHFVRGYFDGDGCIYHGYYQQKNKNYQRKYVCCSSFTSGSKPFLIHLHQLLSNTAGLAGGSVIKRAANHFVLSYSINDTRQLYKFMYPTSIVPCLKRKFDKFAQAFN
jgi:hypothetical protein